ncbi:hypothetical protein A4X06_0g6069 [Tilletia controversa]|uniref:Uncharacterized protein n=1 Tax=Tilletia controversa TaxID=13291 RepID=A0A8X7SV60_9BASI|nr:hypothetical protein A4X06_0g6069 [Tilletia controversa]
MVRDEWGFVWQLFGLAKHSIVASLGDLVPQGRVLGASRIRSRDVVLRPSFSERDNSTARPFVEQRRVQTAPGWDIEILVDFEFDAFQLHSQSLQG